MFYCQLDRQTIASRRDIRLSGGLAEVDDGEVSPPTPMKKNLGDGMKTPLLRNNEKSLNWEACRIVVDAPDLTEVG